MPTIDYLCARLRCTGRRWAVSVTKTRCTWLLLDAGSRRGDVNPPFDS
jgi:hypothetical protein